jgi:hypothetical protein
VSFSLVVVRAVVEDGGALAVRLEAALKEAAAAFLAENPGADVRIDSDVSNEDDVRARLGLGARREAA